MLGARTGSLCSGSSCAFDRWGSKDIGITRRLEIVGAEGRHWKLARLFAIEVRSFVLAGEFLSVDLALQFHESMQECLRPRRTSGNVNVHGNVPIDPFQHVVSLFERPTGNRAGPHRDHILRVGHLVVEPHDLRRHFFGDSPGHDHEIGLARRWPEHFAAETGEIVARRRGRDHLDRATGEPELERPDRILPAPVVKFLRRSHPDAALLQLAPQSFVDLVAHRARSRILAQSKQPLLHAQTSPSRSNKRKTRIAMKAPNGNPVNATANGTKNTASTSKTRKMMQYK